jgi:hypothetical protein
LDMIDASNTILGFSYLFVYYLSIHASMHGFIHPLIIQWLNAISFND